MYTLFIDTHSKNVLIILFKDGKIVTCENLETKNKHSEVAMPMIDKVLKDSNADVTELNEIVVVNGPGSFTGERIAVTIGKTIAYCLSIPIKVIDALTVIAINVNGDRKIVSLEDRTGAFVGTFDKENKVIEDIQYMNNSIYKEYKNNNEIVTDIEIDYEKVMSYINNLNALNPHEVKPLYIKGISALNDK